MEINYINEFLEFINHVQNEKGIYIVGGGRYGKVFGYYLNANNVLWNGLIDSCALNMQRLISKKGISLWKKYLEVWMEFFINFFHFG